MDAYQTVQLDFLVVVLEAIKLLNKDTALPPSHLLVTTVMTLETSQFTPSTTDLLVVLALPPMTNLSPPKDASHAK